MNIHTNEDNPSAYDTYRMVAVLTYVHMSLRNGIVNFIFLRYVSPTH